MRMLKQCSVKAAAAVMCAAAVCVLTACQQKQVMLDSSAMQEQVVGAADGIRNFELPEIGDEIAVLTIKDYGDVKIRLFPDETEKGTENFKKLVESGFYDELIFHRIVDGFVIQGGDPKGNGTGGVDAWGSTTGFEQTISNHLCHVTGAVAYAIGEDKLNKSQFYIVTGQELNSDYFAQLRSQLGLTFTPAVESLYLQTGGQPYLDGGYEIFGQVFDGLEHCLAIQKVAVDENGKPKSAVVIEKAEITEYDGTVPHWLNAAGEEIKVSSSSNSEG